MLSTVLDSTVRPDPPTSKAHERAAEKTLAADCDRIARVISVRRTATDRLAFDTQRPAGQPVALMLEDGPLQPDLAASILIQTAYALSVAHDLGLVHGALSTASVLVEEHAGGAVARVTDFGIGTLSWDTHQRNPETVPTSPERVLGLERSPAEDVYLFGCLAFSMLTGHPVFETGSVEEIRRSHAIEDAPRVSQYGAGRTVPRALRRLVRHCLVKEAEDRFADGRELLTAVRQAIAESEIETPYDAIGLPDFTEPIVTPPQPPANEPPPPPVQRTGPPPPPPPRKPAPGHPPTESPPPAPATSGTLSSEQPTAVEPRPTSDTRGPSASPPPPPSRTEPAEATTERPTSSSSILETNAQPRPPRPRRRAVRWSLLGTAAVVTIGGSWVATQNLGTAKSEIAVAASRSETPKPRPGVVDTRAAEPEPEPELEPEPEPEDEPSPRDDVEPSTQSDPPAPPEPPVAARDKTQSSKSRKSKQRHRDKPRSDDGPSETNVDALVSQAKQAFQRGDFRAAARHLERAVHADPRNGELRIRLGDAYFKLGQLDKAAKHFERAASLGHPSAKRRLAHVRDARG